MDERVHLTPDGEGYQLLRDDDPVAFARSLRMAAALCAPNCGIQLMLTPDMARSIAHSIDAVPAVKPEPVYDTAGVDLPRPMVWTTGQLAWWLVIFWALGALLGRGVTLYAVLP